jgi:ribonuclease III
MAQSEPDRGRAPEAFARASGLSFRNRSYLELALTHSSFTNENPSYGGADNQRLEYLGDAILGFLVAEWLYTQYPDAGEGELTSLRAFVVRTESLAQLGRDMRIGHYLRMGRGEESSGGRAREANLAAAVEALIGAVYLDRGMEVTRVLVGQHLDALSEDIERQRSHKNAKTFLQEYTQLNLGVTPVYEIVDQAGPDHALTFTARVLIAGEIWGEGVGLSKRAAEQAAARAAIDVRLT